MARSAGVVSSDILIRAMGSQCAMIVDIGNGCAPIVLCGNRYATMTKLLSARDQWTNYYNR